MLNNLESFTDFHKRKRKDCIESLENYLRGKHFEAIRLSKPSQDDFLINFEKEELLKDVLADLMHWARANNLTNFDQLLDRARDYFQEERNGDWEEWNDKQEGEQFELELRDKNGHLSEDFISEDE